MDYIGFLKMYEGKRSKVGIIGATKGYGYTLLAQLGRTEQLTLRLVCSRHADECIKVLQQLQYEGEPVICRTAEEVRKVPEGCIIIITDYRLAYCSDIDSLVECTGNTVIGAEIASEALRSGKNVYMVSKETDSFCGPYLNRLAKEMGKVYSLVNGDQPRDLLDLYSWVKTLGLEVICIGKSSEYDFVWDYDTEIFSYQNETESFRYALPELRNSWHYKDRGTLAEREKLFRQYMAPVPADLCEMNLVSNITGFLPAAEGLSYPVAKISELPEIFVPEEDGGILKRTGVVDVFINMHAPDEASFAGGEFAIVRCHDDQVWKLLKRKGHVVSRSGKYACIYWPYHFMGVETPVSLMLGDLAGIGTHPECRQHSIMCGRAEEDLPAGTALNVTGYHHEISGLSVRLVDRKDHEQVAPFYLMNGHVLIRDVKKDAYITLEDIDAGGTNLEMYRKGLGL